MLFTKSFKRKIVLIIKFAILCLLHHLKQRNGSQHWAPSSFSPLRYGNCTCRCSWNKSSKRNPLAPTSYDNGAAWIVPVRCQLGSTQRWQGFFYVLLIPLAFLASPSHTDIHWTSLSGDHITNAWSAWQCGGATSPGIPPPPQPGVLIQQAHKKEVSYTWWQDGFAAQQWKVRTHSAMG